MPLLATLLATSALQPPALPRRAALAAGAGGLGLLLPRRAALAAESGLAIALEATRDRDAYLAPDVAPLVQRPAYGLEAPDVFYPEWCLGKWRVSSTLAAVHAPAGEAYFSPGRNGSAALERARAEVGEPLAYECRWVRDAAGRVVVDREYNVASITRASMGASAVQDTASDGPDKLTMYIQPSAARSAGVYRADLLVVSRRSEADALPSRFACAETVRQGVVLVPTAASAVAPPPQVKEVEAICTYAAPSGNTMLGAQRTATFLVPDAAYTSSPSLAELGAMSATRGPSGRQLAIDLRHYDLVYTRA